MWSANSDEKWCKRFYIRITEDKILSFVRMGIVDEKYSLIDINEIIASKNINDPITIEVLSSIVLMKKQEMQSMVQYEDSTQFASWFTVKVNLNFNDVIGNKFDDEITCNFGYVSIFLSKNLIIGHESRLRTHVDEPNNVQLEK
jgi:hypothetical protein